MRCDMANMLRGSLNAISPKLDHYGMYAAGVEMLIEHIGQLRDGSVPLDEFADFYMLRPAAVVQPPHPSHDGQAQSASPNGDDAREFGR